MLPLRAPIPLVTLFLSAACQPKDKTTASDTETDETSSGAPTTSDISEWFPPVACGDVVCPAGEFCLYQEDECFLKEAPDDPETGTSGGTYPCLDTMTTETCTRIPEDCRTDPQSLKSCLESLDDFCSWYTYDDFSNGTLRCEEVPCQEFPVYSYCY